MIPGLDSTMFLFAEMPKTMPSIRLPDALYRKLLKARAVLVLGDGTIQTFSRGVRMIDGSATVRDNRNMNVRVVTSARSVDRTCG